MGGSPRIIKYKSDECVAKGDYMQAVWECLKESGVFSKKYRYRNYNHAVAKSRFNCR